MKKADWLILLCVMIISYTLLYFFKASESQKPQTTPPQEVVQPVVPPEVKPPEVTKPEIPETIVFTPNKGMVTFMHSAHAEVYGCNDCHHMGTTRISCRRCHHQWPFVAFHKKSSTLSCVGCHTTAGAGPEYLPCSGCHKK